MADVEETLAAADLLPADRTAVVAVSGGLDSMLLLRVLAELRPRHRCRLIAAHFHHQLRGPDADADERLVDETARQWHVPCVIGTADVRLLAEPGESLEAAARRMRHVFLAKAAREHGGDRVATAHHADDQVELFLMRLLRGAGSAGLAGMPNAGPSPADSGVVVVRPFLSFPRARLVVAAREMGVVWREDTTNRDTRFLRNRVRHQLVPLLTAQYQPSLSLVLRRVQALLRDQAAAMEEMARDWLRAGKHEDWPVLPTAVQRDIVRVQLHRLGVTPGFELIESLRLFPDLPVQIGPTQRVTRGTDGVLQMQPPASGLEPFRFDECLMALDGGEGACQFGGVDLQWRLQEVPTGAKADFGPARSGVEVFDADSVGAGFRLRHWHPGDRFRPLGMPVAGKLQDLFTNARIPASRRRGLVLAETGAGELFWVEGLRIGECAKVTSSTRRCLEWRWTRASEVEPQVPEGPV